MSVLHDAYCKCCDHELDDVWFKDGRAEHDDIETVCPECCGTLGVRFTRLNTDAWGAPRHITSLDMTFDSHSDLKKHLKDNGLQEAGDKVGGSRNESGLGLGTIYSGAGIGSRRSYSADYGTQGVK